MVTRSTEESVNPMGSSVCSLFLLGGVLLVTFAAYLAWMGQASQSWPRVQGHVISSEVSESARRRDTKIRYAYTVDDIRYESDRIQFGPVIGIGPESADAYVERFPPDSRPRIAYDPENPGRSVLVPGIRWGTLVIGAAGLALFGVLIYIRRRLEAQPSRPVRWPEENGPTPFGSRKPPPSRRSGMGLLILAMVSLGLVGYLIWPAVSPWISGPDPRRPHPPSEPAPESRPPSADTEPRLDPEADPEARRQSRLQEVESLGRQAKALYRDGRLAQSEALHRKRLDRYLAIESDRLPDLPAIHAELAFVLFKRNKLEEAESHYQQAIVHAIRLGLESSHAMAWYQQRLGDVHAASGRPKAARTAYLEALEIWRGVGGAGRTNAETVKAKLSELDKRMEQIDLRGFQDFGNLGGLVEATNGIRAERDQRAGTRSAGPPQPELNGAADAPIRVRIRLSESFSVGERFLGASWTPFTNPTSETRPPEITAEPDYRGAVQRYGRLRLGTGPDPDYHFVFDVPDAPHPAVYFDRNNNKDLTDDGPPLTNEGTGIFAARIDLPFEQLIRETDFEAPYTLWFFVNESAWERGFANHYARTHLEGEVTLNGERLRAYILETGLHDADFTNDGISFDLNGNGKIDWRTEHVKPGEVFQYEGRRYQFEILW